MIVAKATNEYNLTAKRIVSICCFNHNARTSNFN